MAKEIESTRAMRVGVLLIDGFALMSYASVVEPLRAANLLARRELFHVGNYAASGTTAISSNGAAVKTSGDIGSNPDFDLFLVVAGGDDLVDQIGVQNFRDEARADALDHVRRMGAALQDLTQFRLDRDDPDVRF